MMDPRRLLDGEASEAERALLRAGRAEEPPAHGTQRLAAALGVSLGPPPPTPASDDSSATSLPEAAAATLTGKVALKWLWIAGVGAAITTTALVLQSRTRGPATRSAEVQAAMPAVRDARAGSADAQANRPMPSTIDPAVTTAAPRDTGARANPGSLAREIARLDAVRLRLQRGHARGALAALAAYRREHPAGVLEQEAELLRIEALWRIGDKAGVVRHGSRFLRERPDSPHIDRVRALTNGSSE